MMAYVLFGGLVGMSTTILPISEDVDRPVWKSDLKGGRIMANRILFAALAVVLIGFSSVSLPRIRAAQRALDVMSVNGDDIGGIVTSSHGPEAGVWVIAETNDLPATYRKIV